MPTRQPAESIGVEQARIASRRWGFYQDNDNWWFGPVPATAESIDLCAARTDELDNLQVLCATGYLQRCGRNDDAARLFATQTGCTLAEARQLCHNGEVPADATFPPPPWPLATTTEMRSAIAHRRRANIKALAAFMAGALLVAVVALAIVLM